MSTMTASAVTTHGCRLLFLLLGFVICHTKGACEFPKHWSGHWFQSGLPQTLLINSTHILTKGECYEEQADKYLVYDKSEDCYRCMAIHEKHSSVLQYKETYCEHKSTFQDICYGITGDAPLYSMFRKDPESRPVPCPFKSAPFTLSYNRGSGDCTDPFSKAESCTDDSRLVLKYQACPDTSTESNVEELVCLATWKEGSTRYLIGKISQVNRRSNSDEDQYRCFIYQRSMENGRGVYNIAQSGDATCNGLQNAFEGSRTMKLTTVDNHHNRCKFPLWITDHHTWLSLDHRKTYRFSQRNATLKILDEEPPSPPYKHHHQHSSSGSGGHHQQHHHVINNGAGGQVTNGVGVTTTGGIATVDGGTNQYGFQQFGLESDDQRRSREPGEQRVVCHSILQALEQKRVQIVAHVTAGCNSGYVCMVFYKRDSNVIEIQQSEEYAANPNDACRYFDTTTAPYVTLITTTLHPKKCPHLGRFVVSNNNPTVNTEKRKKRQQTHIGMEVIPNIVPAECLSHSYEALAIGCSGSNELMEFKTPCPTQPTHGYTCHGSWQENNTYYVVTSPIARKSSDSLRYCFIYTMTHEGGGATGSGGGGGGGGATVSPVTTAALNQYGGTYAAMTTDGSTAASMRNMVLRLSGVSESCHRDVQPGVDGLWAFNFTTNGTCAQSRSENTGFVLIVPSVLVLVGVLTTLLVLR